MWHIEIYVFKTGDWFQKISILQEAYWVNWKERCRENKVYLNKIVKIKKKAEDKHRWGKMDNK